MREKFILWPEADADVTEAYYWYEGQEPGLGVYFLDCLFSDIDSLLVYAGVHAVTYAYHRCLSKRFPFAIYYSLEEKLVRVHAVLDCRRNPSGPARPRFSAHSNR